MEPTTTARARVHGSARVPLLLAVLLIAVAGGAGFVLRGRALSPEPLPAVTVPPARIETNEQYLEAVRSSALDLDDPTAVFAFVFAQLPPRVHVFPTENYWYFRFFTSGHEIAGSIELDAVDRQQGLVGFHYFSTVNRPEHLADLYRVGRSVQLGHADGVQVTEEDPLDIAVTFRGRTVSFRLHDLSQEPPPTDRLADGETFVARTFDESGFQFLLLFNEQTTQFLFVLDDTAPLPDALEERGLHLHVGRRSGFAFLLDTMRDRYVLVGVDDAHARRNTWYDGPTDQLADNFVSGDRLRTFIERAYPVVRERIDARGAFVDAHGRRDRDAGRLALTPYRQYMSLADLDAAASACQGVDPRPDMVIACLTRDEKQNLPAPGP